MQEMLFVYGSLLSACAHPQGERLRHDADLLGTATIQARLFAVSWYPCVKLSDDPADRVEGELYRLRTPAVSLAWLDAYESITPGPTGVAAHDEYERILVSALLPDSAACSTWLYHYRRDVTGLARVASGSWSNFLRSDTSGLTGPAHRP